MHLCGLCGEIDTNKLKSIIIIVRGKVTDQRGYPMSIRLSIKQMSIIDQYKIIHLLHNKVGNNAFWAKDVEDIVSPAMLTSFRKFGILKNTDVTQEHFILINEYNETYKKVIVKQWQFCDNFKQSWGIS